MAIKFMRVKRIVLSILTVAILASQLGGCAAVQKNELLEMLEQGETITIELPVTDWDSAQAKQLENVDWVELATLKTYTTTGFRAEVDKLFNINTVATQQGNTKQGCLYTIHTDGEDRQSGNTTLRDAFRNKVFMGYWETAAVQNGLSDTVEMAYTDIDHTSPYAVTAALNAYYNLMADKDGDTTYEATQSLTREQFYTLVFKAGNPVQELEFNGDNDEFAILTNTNHYYTPFAKQLASNGYLKTSNGSLNATNISTPISKLEALYLVVNTYFSDEAAKVALDQNTTAFGYKNAGDQITDKKFNAEGTSKAIENNLLAYLVDTHGEKGIDQTIMPYLVVAEKLGLGNGINLSDELFSSITKDEALRLLVNVYQAENELHGYLTNTEYGQMDTLDGQGITAEQPGQSDAEDYTEVFEKIYGYVYSLSGNSNFEEEKRVAQEFVDYGELPANGVILYTDWRLLAHPHTEPTTSTTDSQDNTQSTPSTPATEPTAPSTPSTPNTPSTPQPQPSTPGTDDDMPDYSDLPSDPNIDWGGQGFIEHTPEELERIAQENRENFEAIKDYLPSLG